jgi:hypothetical protein
VHLLARHGLFINDKSVLLPKQRIEWLGKHIHAPELSLFTHPSRFARALLHLWSLRCSHLTFRRLQRLLGFMQWLRAPVSYAAPFLSSAYALLRSPNIPTILPRAIWRSLLHALLMCMTPVRGRPLPPPLTMPLIFCDAAPFGSSFLVGVCKLGSFASVAQTPAWVRSMQQAEMYALFHTLRQIVHHRLSMACVVTDNAGTFYTVATGRCSAYCRTRLRLAPCAASIVSPFNTAFNLSSPWFPQKKTPRTRFLVSSTFILLV